MEAFSTGNLDPGLHGIMHIVLKLVNVRFKPKCVWHFCFIVTLNNITENTNLMRTCSSKKAFEHNLSEEGSF